MSTRQNCYAAERWDVIEETVPESVCAVRGCQRESHYPMPDGIRGKFWVCARHRPLYREHFRILRRIRSL